MKTGCSKQNPKPGTKILKIWNSTLHIFAQFCENYALIIFAISFFFLAGNSNSLRIFAAKNFEKVQNKELHILTFYRQTFLLVL
jgi:hypothetical protein